MFNNAYFDTIICIVLVYALLSIVVSFVVEWWNEKVKARGAFLQMVVRRILRDDLNHDYGYRLYQHPTINRMRKDRHSYPAYLSAETFGNALIETLADDAGTEVFVPTVNGAVVNEADLPNLPVGTPVKYVRRNDMADKPLAQRFVAGVVGMKESPMRRLFLNFIDRNGGRAPEELDLHALKTEVGRWFDDHMDRASGEFKMKLKPKLLGIGMLVAIILNVDTVHLIKVFMLDEPLRDRTVAMAEQVGDKYAEGEDLTDEERMQNVTDAIVAWNEEDTSHAIGGKDTLVVRLVREMKVDSALEQKRKNAVAVLDRLNRLQLPLGWDMNDAPMTWFHCTTSMADKADNPAEASLLRYFDARNRITFKNVVLWLLGIVITGLALSRGAPFWFEALVKLVNIRRAGVKPKATQGSTSD